MEEATRISPSMKEPAPELVFMKPEAKPTTFRADPCLNPHYNWPYKKLPGKGPSHPGWIASWLRKKGSRPLSVTEKEVTTTDINANHNRLLLPRKDVREHLCEQLTQAELVSVEGRQKGDPEEGLGHHGMPVKVLDSLGREYDMHLKFWPSNKGYIFNTVGWKQFREANELEEGEKLRIFFFRSEGGGEARASRYKEGKTGAPWFVMAVESPAERKERKEETRKRRQEKEEKERGEGKENAVETWAEIKKRRI